MNIIDLYSRKNEEIETKFLSSTLSTLKVKSHYLKNTYDDTWLIKMETTIRYLDNILRNPNRFIVNDEEIVKIELARRITVDSIKHLAKHTNLIQQFDPKTGEVKPSKILNINKEESFNTYENRFIYSLINNMKLYIEKKKQEEILGNSSKDDKMLIYQGSSNILHEKIDLSLTLNSKLDTKEKNEKDNDIYARITRLEEQIRDLCNSEVYKSLSKLHVSLVTSPIKKTNLILKNTNFQYALELWNYLQSNMESSSKVIKDDKNYEDNGILKDLMDQSFYLNYLIIQTLEDNNTSVEEKTNVSKEVVKTMIKQLVNLNQNVSLDEVKDMVSSEYVKVKYKKVADKSLIEDIYKEAINKYVDKTENMRVNRDER
mgnify:CR=1 FL=1